MTTRPLLALLLTLVAACDPEPIYCDPAVAPAVELAMERTDDHCELECLDEFLGCLATEGPGVTDGCRLCEFTAAVCASSCAPSDLVSSSPVRLDR
jgi:hypothetical protein